MEDTYKTIVKRRKKANFDWLMNLLTFLFPFLSTVAAFAITKVHPFGDNVMLTVDSYHQYAPFLIELRNKIIGGRSLFYSWNGGLGNEFYAIFANYCSSPLNIFCVFFTAKTMPMFAMFVTAVRAGLASLFMSWFLTGEDKGRRDFITAAFSCAYALCGWFTTDFWNLMWCDALVLVPLICLGLRKLFTEGKYSLYTISLAIAIISNYYTGYFICLFMVLFAPVYYVSLFQTKKEPVVEGRFTIKSIAVNIFRFSFCSLIAGGMSAILLIPTYKILQQSSAIGTEFPKEYGLENNFFDFLGRFLVSANPNIRDGMANIYSGIIPVLMVILFFAASKKTGIRLRHKIAYGALLIVMYLSFTNRTLNFIWHGFHFPNQIPYRESFLFSFLMVFLGFKAIRVLRTYAISQVSAVFIGAGVYLILFEKFGAGNETYIQILLTMLFVIIEGVILRCTVAGKKSPLFYEIVIAVIMALEMTVTCCVNISSVSAHEGFPPYDTYGINYDKVKAYCDDVEYSEGHKAFERTEVYPNNFCDIQSIYDLRGISVFSSTVRQSYVDYMKNFGFHNNRLNSVRSLGITRVTASLFGVRNFIASDETESVPNLFELEHDDGYIKCYGNKDALSVGYMVSDAVVDYVPDPNDRDPFRKTNLLVRSMGVHKDVYRRIASEGVDLENVSVSTASMGDYQYSVINSNNATKLSVMIDDATIGSDVYIYLDSNKGGSFYITRYDENGNEISKTASLTYRYYQIIPLGVYDGNPIKCTISLPSSPVGSMKLYSYELDRDTYDKMIDQLSSEELNVTSYDDRSITGTITTENGGFMFLSLVYSDGFKAYVDGRETRIIAINDALMGIELAPGTHEVSLYYTPIHYDTGRLITIASVLIFILFVGGRALIAFSDNYKPKKSSEGSESPEGPENPEIKKVQDAEKTQE